MRVELVGYPLIYNDDDGDDLIFTRDPALEKVVLSGVFENWHGGRIKLVTGETLALDFGDVEDVRGFWIQVDGDCTLAINGAAPLDFHRGQDAATATARALLEVVTTALSLAHDMGAADVIRGHYVVWGDPVA